MSRRAAWSVAAGTVAVLAAAGAIRFFTLPIEGGIEADPEDFPFVVKLVRHDDPASEPQCGGIAIARQWVLTAAHCVHDERSVCPRQTCDVMPAGSSRAFSFQTNIRRGYDPRAVDATNDLALLRLRANGDVERVASWSDDILSTNEIGRAKFVAFGWSGLDVLQRSRALEREKDASCERALGQTVQPGDELCVRRDDGAPCRGDSGSPVFTATGANWVIKNPKLKGLVGVVSQARTNCGSTDLAVIAALDRDDREWIRQLTGR